MILYFVVLGTQQMSGQYADCLAVIVLTNYAPRNALAYKPNNES